MREYILYVSWHAAMEYGPIVLSSVFIFKEWLHNTILKMQYCKTVLIFVVSFILK